MTRISASERRQALIEAAMRVVAARGVVAATTRAIVAEAGMSLASFHYAFTSRDELMAELIDFVVGHEERALQPRLASADAELSIREMLRSGFQDYFDLLSQDPPREKAMFELTQYAMRSGMEDLARRQYRRYYALAASALETAAQKTRVTWCRPVAEVATLLVVLTDGLTLAWLVNRDDRAAAAILDFAADSVAALASPTMASPIPASPILPTAAAETPPRHGAAPHE